MSPGRIARIALVLLICGSRCALAATPAGTAPAGTAPAGTAPAGNASAQIVDPIAPATIAGGASAGSRPTGLLRLLSATQPIADPQLEEPIEAPAPESDSPTPGASPDNAPLRWINPHEYGAAPPPEKPFWKRWMPPGMDPWGPRTALSGRSTGEGIPLTTTSWLNRPYSAGWFAGGVIGPPLISGVGQRGGFFGGYRFGWDYDFYWGLEARIAGSEISLSENLFPPQGLTAGYFLLDANLLYYPWGDSVWRPYASLGLGVSNINFYDPTGHRYNSTMLGLPLGVGLKYYWTPRFILRADLMDNLGFGGDINVVSNFTLTGGVEFRFGGPRRSYWPWNTGRTIW